MRTMNLMEIDLALLEPGQRSAATVKPIGRRRLGRAGSILLWTLRVYVTLAVPLVVFACIRSVTSS